MKRLGKKGFTLVEIMIVISIIALLAAIAIPNLLRARHNANETAAIASLRTISTAVETYRAARTPASYAPGGIAVTLNILATEIPPYIDAVLGDAAVPSLKQGYEFRLFNVTANTYLGQAKAQNYQTTGTRSFTVDESGVIRASDMGSSAWLGRGAGTVIE